MNKTQDVKSTVDVANKSSNALEHTLTGEGLRIQALLQRLVTVHLSLTLVQFFKLFAQGVERKHN